VLSKAVSLVVCVESEVIVFVLVTKAVELTDEECSVVSVADPVVDREVDADCVSEGEGKVDVVGVVLLLALTTAETTGDAVMVTLRVSDFVLRLDSVSVVDRKVL